MNNGSLSLPLPVCVIGCRSAPMHFSSCNAWRNPCLLAALLYYPHNCFTHCLGSNVGVGGDSARLSITQCANGQASDRGAAFWALVGPVAVGSDSACLSVTQGKNRQASDRGASGIALVVPRLPLFQRCTFVMESVVPNPPGRTKEVNCQAPDRGVTIRNLALQTNSVRCHGTVGNSWAHEMRHRVALYQPKNEWVHLRWTDLCWMMLKVSIAHILLDHGCSWLCLVWQCASFAFVFRNKVVAKGLHRHMDSSRSLTCLCLKRGLALGALWCGCRRMRHQRHHVRRLQVRRFSGAVMRKNRAFLRSSWFLFAVVLLVVAIVVLWVHWTHACRVGEAKHPGPGTKHLRCDHCWDYLSSHRNLRNHILRFHAGGADPYQVEADVNAGSSVAAEDPYSMLGDSSEASVIEPEDSDSDSLSEEAELDNTDLPPASHRPFKIVGEHVNTWIGVTANITSMWTQLENVFALPCHFAALQEVRLTEMGQNHMNSVFQEKGWSIVHGKPLACQKTIWHCKAGGVAVVAAPGLCLQNVVPACDIEQSLWDTGRFVHAAIAYGNGRRVIHVISVYGYSGAQGRPEIMRKNESLLCNVFKVAAALGNVPVLVMGDINVDPDASPAVQSAARLGGCVDSAKVCAVARGISCDRTCFVRDTSLGTRIDAIFCNAAARGALGDCGVLDDCAVPTHRPVACELRLEAYAQEANVLRRPGAISLDFVDPDADAALSFPTVVPPASFRNHPKIGLTQWRARTLKDCGHHGVATRKSI